MLLNPELELSPCQEQVPGIVRARDPGQYLHVELHSGPAIVVPAADQLDVPFREPVERLRDGRQTHVSRCPVSDRT